MIALEAAGVTVRRGGRAIVDAVDLRAAAGDFVAVIGANGAGKSTLLSVLSGLVKPDAGIVTYGGIRIGSLPGAALARRRSFLPQSPRCEWPISVERLVALGLTPALPAFGSFAGPDRERIAEVLEACDLTARRDQAATSLSGGELARAMLARAIVSDPDVLIVDEPLAGLDPRHLIDAARRLRAYAQTGKIVIASLHDLTVAGRYATRMIALRAGRVINEGATDEVFTTDLIHAVFDVDATLSPTPHGTYVDYTY